MQIYLNRALSTFLFPLGLITASFIFIGLRKGWRRQALTWPLGAAVSYILCVLFQWLKDAAFSAKTGPASSVEYFTSLERFIVNYLLNFGIKLILFELFIELMRYAYDIDRKEAASASCTAVAAETLGTFCFEIAVVRYGPNPISFLSSITANWSTVMLYIGFHLGVYLLCWWVFVNKLSLSYISQLPRRVLMVVEFITIAVIFSSCITAPPTESEYMAHLVLQITRLTLCLTILLLQYYIISWFTSQFEQTQLAALMKFQEKHYEVTKERMEVVNQNAHDMKYKLRTIMDELQGGETENIHGELSAIRESIRAWEAIYHTGSVPLDVVLSEKAALCDQEAIQFSVIADGACLGFMTDTDIYTLFGNALDNAIEAVRKVQDQSERLVSLSLRQNRGFALLHIENSYAGAVEFREGEPITSKEEKAFHGFGVKSIKNIAGKYGGRVTLTAGERLFSLDIVLPINEKQ